MCIRDSTGSNAGLMTNADKTKLDGIESGADEFLVSWTISHNSGNYRFAGPGFAGTENNPTLYVVRGQKYKINSSIGSHPFNIGTVAKNTSSSYNNGITGNNLTNGTLEWVVRMDAPNEMVYYCSSHHTTMVGTIVVLDETQVVSHRQAFSSDGSSPEIYALHQHIFNPGPEPRYDGGRVVIDTTNLGNNAADKIQLDLSELYHPDHVLSRTLNFEVYAKGASAFSVEVINPASGPAAGQQTLKSDVSSQVQLAEDATGTIAIGSGQYLVIYCDGADWYYEKRSGL